MNTTSTLYGNGALYLRMISRFWFGRKMTRSILLGFCVALAISVVAPKATAQHAPPYCPEDLVQSGLTQGPNFLFEEEVWIGGGWYRMGYYSAWFSNITGDATSESAQKWGIFDFVEGDAYITSTGSVYRPVPAVSFGMVAILLDYEMLMTAYTDNLISREPTSSLLYYETAMSGAARAGVLSDGGAATVKLISNGGARNLYFDLFSNCGPIREPYPHWNGAGIAGSPAGFGQSTANLSLAAGSSGTYNVAYSSQGSQSGTVTVTVESEDRTNQQFSSNEFNSVLSGAVGQLLSGSGLATTLQSVIGSLSGAITRETFKVEKTNFGDQIGLSEVVGGTLSIEGFALASPTFASPFILPGTSVSLKFEGSGATISCSVSGGRDGSLDGLQVPSIQISGGGSTQVKVSMSLNVGALVCVGATGEATTQSGVTVSGPGSNPESCVVSGEISIGTMNLELSVFAKAEPYLNCTQQLFSVATVPGATKAFSFTLW